MAGFIFFKIIDMIILSFYDLFDNSDIFNTSLAITFEKLIWMIVEAIIDAFIVNKKALILVQIIVTSVFFAMIIIFICFDCCEDKCRIKE